jgi:TetR/AcrR family transcriptional regulator
VAVWRDSPAHAAELLGDNARLSAQLIDTYNAALRDLLASAVSTAHPGVDAVEFAERHGCMARPPFALMQQCPHRNHH